MRGIAVYKPVWIIKLKKKLQPPCKYHTDKFEFNFVL